MARVNVTVDFRFFSKNIEVIHLGDDSRSKNFRNAGAYTVETGIFSLLTEFCEEFFLVHSSGNFFEEFLGEFFGEKIS
jgi:hypothetical protein